MKKASARTRNEETIAEIQPMVLTVTDLQKALCLSHKTVYDLVNQPGFPSFRIGSRILINKAAMQRWLDDQTDQNRIAA